MDDEKDKKDLEPKVSSFNLYAKVGFGLIGVFIIIGCMAGSQKAALGAILAGTMWSVAKMISEGIEAYYTLIGRKKPE